MPNIGPVELVIILVIALLILGPGKLPDVGAALGKSIKEFRKASSDVQEAVSVDTSPLPATPAAPRRSCRSPGPGRSAGADHPGRGGPAIRRPDTGRRRPRGGGVGRHDARQRAYAPRRLGRGSAIVDDRR